MTRSAVCHARVMPPLDGDVLRARGLVKQYKRIRAVDGIDLTVGAGERLALLGPNGAGNTTTLLLILDEPTASLDPDVALKVRTGLNRLCAEDGAALLVTSHNMVEVERLCDRVVFISQGKIVADGRPGDVAARFGRADLEGVFLHLAEEREERVPEQRRRRGA